MNYEEILKKANETIDEIADLKKSYDEKMKKEAKDEEHKEEDMDKAKHEDEDMEKAAGDEPASDAIADLMHQADEHSEDEDAEESVEDYAGQLSDEELYELMSALSEEAEKRGVGEDSDAPGEEDHSEEEPAEKMEMSDDDGMSSLEDKVKGLDEDELEMLMEACAKEKKSRAGGDEEEPAEKMLPDASGAYMMKSVQEQVEIQNAAVTASIEKLAETVNGLMAKVQGVEEGLSKSQEAAASAESAEPAATYADPKVKVLEKSAKESAAKYLTGNDLQNWLLGEQRQGNEKVKSDYVASAGLVKSEEAADTFYRQMAELGIKVPMK